MAITATEQTNIIRLVVGMFNAAPGATYLNAIASLYEANGHNLNALAATLSGNPGFTGIYSNALTSQQFATQFLTTLGLQNSTLANDFIVAKANSGEPRGQIILDAITILSTTGATDFQAAKALLANKVELATFYSIDLHVAETNLGTLQNVLSTITSDHATVVAEENVLTFVPPQTFNLTTGTDGPPLINPASGVNSVVTGTADVGGTFTTGDIINGNATTTFNLTVNGTPPSLATVTNVGTVNINADATSVVNGDLWSGIGLVDLVAPTLNGTVTTLLNAQVATTYGIVGNNGGLTVTFRDTTGTADTAHGFLSGAGVTATPATLDLSSGNTVEAMTLLTTGANFATVNAGTADKTVTITGDGANTLTFGALAATMTVDASATTAAQKLTFVAGSVGTEDTIKGGSGADTVTANASLNFAHMTGVETFVTTVNGGVSLYDGNNVSGLTTMTINQGTSAGSEFFTNMKAEFSTLNVNGPTGTQDVNYVTDANAHLTVNYGPGSTLFDTDFQALNVDEVQALTVNLNIGGVDPVNSLSGTVSLDRTDTTDLTLNQNGTDDIIALDVHRADALDHLAIAATADNSDLEVSVDFVNDFDLQGLQTLSIAASGINSSAYLNSWDYDGGPGFSLDLTDFDASSPTALVESIQALTPDTTNAMSLTTLTMTASGPSSEAYADTNIVSVGTLDTVTFTASGNSSYAAVDYAELVNIGDVGAVTFTASGNNSDAGITGDALIFGNLGSLTLTASGNSSSAYVFSGYSNSSDTTVPGSFGVQGDAGDINLVASGNDSSAYIDNILGVFGNLGTLTLESSGASSEAWIGTLLVGGDLNALTLTASGNDSSAFFGGDYTPFGNFIGGDLGTFTLTASGDSASAYLDGDLFVGGSIQTVVLTASGDSASAYLDGGLNVSGDVGSFSLLATAQGAEAYIDDQQVFIGGDLGTLVVTASGNSSSASFDSGTMTVVGNVGSIAVTASGDSATASVDMAVAGNVGIVTVTASGADSSAFATVHEDLVDDDDAGMTISSLSILATGASAEATADVNTGLDGILGQVTIQATKANSSADLTFVGNSFGTIAATTGAPSSHINLDLNIETNAGGTITETGPGTLSIDLTGKSIATLNAAGSTGHVDMTVVAANATTGMTLTTGTNGLSDNVQGGSGVDTFNLGGGADVFNFANIAANGTVLTAATDIVAGGFVSGSDHFNFGGVVGSATSYVEVLTPAATLAAFITAADTALNGTVQYYFGVVGTNGFLAQDVDGTGITNIIQLTGVTDMAAADIQAGI